ncbi:hypothetical protein FXO37_09904 [Capsicum annuum]|nr:hypothetical protein FXO37_09904 [Capsicum annuum]
MKKKYQGTTRVKRAQLQALRRDFETLQMKEGESVISYYARTMEISNKMRFYGEKMTNVTIVEKILRSLTSKYDYVKMNRNSTSEEQALKASTFVSSNSRGRGRGRGREKGREDRGNRDDDRNFRANDDAKGRGKNFDKSKVECYRCHKFGHYQSECYTRLPSDKDEKSNFIESNETETLLMAIDTEEKPVQDVWYLGTGCSNHMSGSKSYFSSLNEGFRSKVSFGDCSTVDAMGKGDIKIKDKNGFEEIISNVLYVTALKSNLLSVGQLQEKGYSIFIGKDVCEIYSPTRRAIAVAKMNSKSGIRRELTTAYTPQQNGISEKKNKTILHMVRNLLAKGKMKKTFWPEAVNWSINVLNRSPTFVVQNMTPEKAWSGRKPTVDHFQIFDCIAYAHIPEENEDRKKLDDKSKKCIFLGVSEASKVYKLLNPLTKKIVISRDVIFDEENTWDWSMQNSTPIIFDTGTKEVDVIPESAVNSTPTTAEILPTLAESSITAETLPTALEETDAAAQSLRRARKKPVWMMDYEAMDDEIEAIERNDTWELIDLTEKHKIIGIKWVYKTKLKENGEINKYKARLVAKGYKKEYGMDYTEVFAPFSRHDTIRMLIALAAQNSWPIFQLDVKSAFLHGYLEEEVFIEQPPGYVKIRSENKVYRLKKDLYGLKQAPRAWYCRIESYFQKMGFQKCPYEPTLFVKIGENGKMLIACLYVDDLIFMGNNSDMFSDFKKCMMDEFDMSDLGKMYYFLGLEVVQSDDGIFVSQKKYMREILNRFKMQHCNPTNIPVEFGLKLTKAGSEKKTDSAFYKQIVGSLMYLTATRPYIMYVFSLVSRYMECPTEMHILAAKRILCYLQGTKDFEIFYRKGERADLIGFTDSDYAGDQDGRKSTSGYVFMLGAGAVLWSSKTQTVVTLSSTEAKFVAATACACQVIWIRRILKELQFKMESATMIFCGNNSAIKLSKNPVNHGRSKHIDVTYYFLRDLHALLSSIFTIWTPSVGSTPPRGFGSFAMQVSCATCFYEIGLSAAFRDLS